jgi:hypothetical protein
MSRRKRGTRRKDIGGTGSARALRIPPPPCTPEAPKPPPPPSPAGSGCSVGTGWKARKAIIRRFP